LSREYFADSLFLLVVAPSIDLREFGIIKKEFPFLGCKHQYNQINQ
jgi:hypothetical protein